MSKLSNSFVVFEERQKRKYNEIWKKTELSVQCRNDSSNASIMLECCIIMTLRVVS